MDDFIYMNNAATSWPKPPEVAHAVSEALTGKPGAAQRGGIEDFDVFDAVRKKIAQKLGVTAHDHIALGCNATWGLNAGLFGYPFQEGDWVVTSTAEHNSVLRPLYALARRGLIKVAYVEADETGRIQTGAWEAALKRHQPRLAVFTHASNATGVVNDAEALADAAKCAGAAILLDASQTCGLENVVAERWGMDMVAFTGHKYLLGPQGTGGLYVRPGLQLTPHLIGGTGSHSDLETMPEAMPLHLEAGTGNEPAYYGLLAALTWAEQNEQDKAARAETLAALRRGLTEAGADVVAPQGDCTPIVSFTIPGYPVAEVGYILEESYGIVCRTGVHCAPKLFDRKTQAGGTVRLSLSRFTTMEEVRTVIDAVREIVHAV